MEIGSIIGVYFAGLLFVFGSNLMLCSLDAELYKRSKYDESVKVVSIGAEWLFWRVKKDVDNKIYLTVFIHELIGILLFIALTISFIISIIKSYEFIVLIFFLLTFIYFCYVIVLNYIVKKRKR